MRPIWKGHITFGLVNVPVVLYPAEQRSDLQLHLIDSRNFARVRYERVNAETGEEVPWSTTVKGYEYDDGNFVVIGQEELKKAAPEATKSVEIEAFVDPAEIDMMYFDKPYFLEPDKKGDRGYALLREAMAAAGKVGIARVVIRTRQYMAAMIPRGNALVLVLLRFHQELRSTDSLNLPGDAEEVGLKKQEIKMARDLVESMSAEWDPTAYHDEYREKLMAYIEKRIESGDTERAPDVEDDEGEPPAPINLMEALKKSLGQQAPPKNKTSKKKPAAKKTTKKAG